MKFNEEKTTDLSRFFIKKSKGKKIDLVKLIKLLYLTDREFLSRYNTVITRDRYVSMKLGPVLSNTYSLITEETGDSYWYKYIQKSPSNILKLVDATKDDPIDNLNSTENKVAEYIYDKYGNYETLDLVDFVHEKCTEWTDPKKFNSGVIDLNLEDVLRALGRDEFQINDITLNLHFEDL